MSISDIVDGVVVDGEADDYVAEEDIDSFDEDDDDDGSGASKATTKRLEELRVDALEKFAELRVSYDKLCKSFKKTGCDSVTYQKAQEALSGQLMRIRFTVKTIGRLCELLRSQVEDVRRCEREIRKIAVDKCGMQQQHFIEVFPGNALNLAWIENEAAAATTVGARTYRLIACMLKACMAIPFEPLNSSGWLNPAAKPLMGGTG
jgi:RNA polymerase primary sigma factor